MLAFACVGVSLVSDCGLTDELGRPAVVTAFAALAGFKLWWEISTYDE